MQDIRSSCHASQARTVEDGFMWQGQGYACTLRRLGPLTKGLLHPDSSAVYFFVIPSEGLSLLRFSYCVKGTASAGPACFSIVTSC